MDDHLSLLLEDAEAASEPFPGLRRRKGEHEEFATAVLAGLARPPRSIPCRFFYDAQGCGLFEEITRLPEYYPTRTETALLEAHANEIAALVGMGRVLIEFGSGSSRKTSLLISALRNLVAYVPIDVSAESLQEAAGWLSLRHFGLNTEPVVADFTKPVTLPNSRAPARSSASSQARPSAISPMTKRVTSCAAPRVCLVKEAAS